MDHSDAPRRSPAVDSAADSPADSPADSAADIDSVAEPRAGGEFGGAVVRWERAAEWPMTCLALLFLAAYATPILMPEIPLAVRRTADMATLAIWALFGIEYAARVWLAHRRWRYVRRHLLELAVLLLPGLRPLRMLRLVLVLVALYRHVRVGFRGTVATYVGGALALVSFLSSVAILDAERGRPGANISTFGDALWWSFATMTTVGYGDHYPTTAEGRMIALALMLIGIGLLGVVTASLAAWFIERMHQVEHAAEHAAEHTVDAVAALRTEIRALREELAQLRASEEPAETRSLAGKH